MAFAVWITGLPGSGKSTISGILEKMLKKSSVPVEYLRLDEFRRKIVPEPEYTEAERDLVYKKLAEMAADHVKSGKSVIIDATAHRKRWRRGARKKIGNFEEVYVRCDIETCIRRESERPGGLVTADMYKKALKRKEEGKSFEGLGEVVGVDVPFEEEGSDLIIESGKVTAEKAADLIFEDLKRRGYVK